MAPGGTSTVIRILASLILLVLLVACRGTQDPGSPFFHGLQSGQAPEEVQVLLGLASEQWHPVDDPNFARSRSYGLRMQRAEIRHFIHLECEGRLVLYFFNERLLRARFHPSDFQRFQKAMAEREALLLNPGAVLEVDPATQVRVLRDHEGGSYVVWEDRELQAQWEAVSRRR